MKALPLAQAYQLIEPGPVVLLTTGDGGTPNVMTMSWHMMVEFEPPLIACVVSSADHSFAALTKTKECVIAVPSADIAPLVVAIGNRSGRDTDKFAEFGIEQEKAQRVKAPLLPQCFANLECRVVDTRLVEKFNLFVLEVVQAWIDPKRRNAKTIHHRGWGSFAVDGEVIRLKSRMR